MSGALKWEYEFCLSGLSVFLIDSCFFVCPTIVQSPEHKPEQSAADIDEPRPPRRVHSQEDEERDQIINEEKGTHSASF